MESLIALILESGKTAVDLALYSLLPIMVVMLAMMKLLDAYGVLHMITRILTPLVRPFGITGLGMFAGIKVLFVSFAAPMASLTMMDQRGVSRRHLATAMTLVFVMSQANASFPMIPFGLDIGVTLLTSLVGGLAGASATYYLFANREEW
ncbi:nucleoside recognition domain-containing protein [Solemya velum gill symbiont]|uniref:Nucleoside transporter/FeoB GTPase Gate domain-containing protein n=1 Tax=Solemya velum gill symbiont TaxID=2340 RepID=A0A0B0HC12_SOVGS|nr:nucleoside recognition domain-containing protein [Solemya velum gill symbiont]KHF25389.1 hypothetical protein JV46_07010 [Solemya velum gill symbiont]